MERTERELILKTTNIFLNRRFGSREESEFAGFFTRIFENMKKSTTLNSTLDLNFMIISMFSIIGGKLRKHNSSMGGDHSQNTRNI